MFYITAIILVGCFGLGFSWQYLNDSRPVVSVAQIVNRTPQILGASSERSAAELDGPVLFSDEINNLFQELCLRPASQEEIQQWTGQSRIELQASLEHSQVYIERYHGRYLDGCFIR